MNPLLDTSGLPRFSKIKLSQIESTIDALLDENRQQLKTLLQQLKENQQYSWQSLIEPLAEMDNRLSRAWSPVSHLNSVKNSDELRKAHDACLPKLSEYSTEQMQNEELYQAYLKLQQSPEFESYTRGQKKTIENALLKFKLNGVALDEKQKAEFKSIKQKLSGLKSKYEQNLLDATEAWMIQIEDKSILGGLPDYALAMAKQAAKNKKMKGWLFTLEMPSYISVMTYADDRELRRDMYTAYSTRASDQGPNKGEYDNSQIMEDILSSRQQMAEIIGFNNYAELSIADKMAETTDEVLGFLNALVEKSLPVAKKEFKELQQFARETDGLDDFSAWDVAYYSEKLKQQNYGLSEEELKPYFPADKVINGLFEIVKRLYDINIQQCKGIDVWHPDVQFFEIRDKDNNLLGQFYLDLYAREKKRGGAWMDECIVRKKTADALQIPVAYLTCNLTPPVGKDPALLTHNEVTTLFHEFGHGLHHMLTQVDEYYVAGINGVEWDAVELPSQFMENWCWQKEGLDLISGHYQTGESLPDDLFEKLNKAKNFQSAMMMVRQLEFSLFDFRLHMEFSSKDFQGIQALLDEVRDQVAVIKPPAFNRFQHGFSHIFAGGYEAGYYSYKWAEVLSADAFSKFEQEGIFNRETGKNFLENILQKGGSEKAMDLFKKFMGRAPKIDALLKHSGLAYD